MNNKEFAIESFISFCDDMMIAEEGLKDIKPIKLLKTALTNLWKMIKGLINKINSFMLKKSTGNDIHVVNKTTCEKFREIEKEAVSCKPDNKKDVEKMITDLMNMSFAPGNGKTDTIRIGYLKEELSKHAKELGDLEVNVEDLLTKLENAEKDYQNKKDIHSKATSDMMSNTDLHGMSDRMEEHFKSGTSELNAKIKLNNIRFEYERTVKDLTKCTLLSSLYSKMITKLTGENIQY